MKNQDKYIVWDGINEEPYTDSTTLHDCMITVDGELISVQKRRREILDKSFIVPTVVFACKSDQSAAERQINGRTVGIFTHFWLDILERNPMVTFRDAICLANIAMQQEGLEQQAEVICRIDILDMPVEELSLPNGHILMTFDMCRTKMEKGNRVIY